MTTTIDPKFATALKDYTIGIVVGEAGCNDNQMAEINLRLKFIVKLLEPHGSKVILVVPGLRITEEYHGVPSNIINLRYRVGVKEIKTLDCGVDGLKWRNAFGTLRGDCDEVWCLPATAHSHATSRGRVMKIYHAGQQSPGGARFKFIPPWVQPELPVTQPTKQKRGKHYHG